MRNEYGKVNGPLAVESDLVMYGMIIEGATVRSGATLTLHGMITGDLIVELGAAAIIYGMVNGTVINNGGRVEILGMVDSVASGPGASTVVHSGAVVRDQARNK